MLFRSFAGILAYVFCYPLNTISTILQVQYSKDGNKIYKGNLDTLIQIMKTEGWIGLYSGLKSGLFAVAITQGVYYYFYEFLKKIFSSRQNSSPQHKDFYNLVIAALVSCSNFFFFPC